MCKSANLLCVMLVIALQFIACDEGGHNVGEPCQPDKTGEVEKTSLALSCTEESDKISLCDVSPSSSNITAEVTYTVEKECDGCHGDDCLNQTVVFDDALERENVVYGFCSCACRDSNGNGPGDNDDLCECPKTTVCSSIGYGSPSYCIPDCMAWGCMGASELCTPPVKDQEPWMWSCLDISK